ncbi:pilus assembly protein TadG-related protein [Microlunatus flavus]|uniref:pilus assembly protein TadG-related protein n=1 Tax=Microlunatus flavus TaxID=1036181 RepID=UPI000B819FE0|nr:pilus assembly protein TadG-related protein [Microlunatus flavus]
MSVFVLAILAALVATAGLVIDGGQKVTAASQAEAAADGAARAAANAAATQRLAGRDGAGAGVLAAKAYLAGQPNVKGSVRLAGGVVRVDASATAPTIFLSAIGVGEVTGTGSATASVVPTGRER